MSDGGDFGWWGYLNLVPNELAPTGHQKSTPLPEFQNCSQDYQLKRQEPVMVWQRMHYKEQRAEHSDITDEAPNGTHLGFTNWASFV